jgi:hypothetical protein
MLTEKQQTFVSRYIESGMTTGNYDAPAAVAAAYKTTAPEILSYQVLGSKKVQRVLNLHLGRSDMDFILERTADLIQKSIRRDSKKGGLSTATTNAIRFLSREQRRAAGGKSEDPDGIEMVPLGKLIERPDGKRYRVTLAEVSQ